MGVALALQMRMFMPECVMHTYVVLIACLVGSATFDVSKHVYV